MRSPQALKAFGVHVGRFDAYRSRAFWRMTLCVAQTKGVHHDITRFHKENREWFGQVGWLSDRRNIMIMSN